MVKLVQSPVVYDREKHEYWLGEKRLMGLTGLISQKVFPGMYSSVSEEVLNKAKERGHETHDECELYDRLGIEKGWASKYKDLCEKRGLVHVDSEYVVSDMKKYASPIDKVFKGAKDGEYILGDIKTTYKLNKEYLSWQLSALAEMFERQNPGSKVTGLVGIWLRWDDGEICDIERKPKEDVEWLLYGDGEMTPNVPSKSDGVPLPKKYKDAEDKIVLLKDIYEEAKENLDMLSKEMRKLMDDNGVKKFVGDRISVTRTADYSTSVFDKRAFKEDYPELYEKYLVEQKRYGSVKISINKQQQ